MEEVIYCYVRGQGWVPRLESDQLAIDQLEWDMSESVFRYLSTAPIVPYSSDPIQPLQGALEYTMRYYMQQVYMPNTYRWVLDE